MISTKWFPIPGFDFVQREEEVQLLLSDQQVLEKCREIFGVWDESLTAAISGTKTDDTIILKYRIYHQFLATS